MKKFILLATSLLYQNVFAAPIVVPVEQKVVELHITERVVSADEKSRRKTNVVNLSGRATCSGAFIDGVGDILTAGHCARNVESIEVVTYDNQTYDAVVVATSSVHDLALIHIDRLHTDYFSPATSITRGEKIFVLGSPLAITNTLSTGIIAKLGGDITLIDCSALPGNSGSPVFDENNKLVGILTAGYIVGLGTTHLNLAQSLDSVMFFLFKVLK